MNYIKEINAFYDWLELNSVRPSTVILWHTLMHLNNKAGWVQEFTVARSVIEAKTGLKKDAYYTARNQLKQLGRIDFKERGTKATLFKINPFLSEKQTTIPTTTQTTDQTRTPTTSPTITKLNETKQSSSNAREEDVFKFYQQNIQNGVSSSPFVLQNIQHWISEMSSDVVLAAMKVAANKEKRGFDYTEGILKKWSNAGVKSLDDARRYESEFTSKKKSNVVEWKQPSGRDVPKTFEYDMNAGEGG